MPNRLLAFENPDNDKLVYACTCMAFLKIKTKNVIKLLLKNMKKQNYGRRSVETIIRTKG